MLWMLLLQSLPAYPCAAMMTKTGEFASSDAQEVILSRTESGSTASYRVTYDGDASEFGWIIVVPGEVSEVTEGNSERFELLRAATNPIVFSSHASSSSGSSGCGCGESSMKGAVAGDANFADTGTGGVEILSEGFSGPYEYTVLSAEDDADLIAWLDTNEFELGGSATTLAEYVDEGGYNFVAVTLTPDESGTPAEGRSLPPLDITTSATELRFPARMAQTGEPEWIRTTIWVIGESTASISEGWTHEDLSWLDAGDQDPTEFLDEHLQTLANSQATYARIYQGQIDGSWVTRFDTHAARSVHTDDPVFEYEPTPSHAQLEILVDDVDAAWLFLPVLGLGWSLRRRRQRST